MEAAMGFMDTLLFGQHIKNSAQWSQYLGSTLATVGVDLFTKLLRVIISGANFRLFNSLTNILFKLVTQYPDGAAQCIMRAFAQDKSFPSDKFSDQEKTLVARLLIKTQHQRKFKMLLKDLSDVAHGHQTIDVFSTYLV